MAYEIYEKVVRRTTTPTMSISKLGRLSFNAAAAETLLKNAVEHVLLLWDKDGKKVGIRRVSKKDGRSYALRFTNKNRMAGFAAKTFLNHIQYDFSETHAYPCTWDAENDMYEVQLPADSFGVVVNPKRPPRPIDHHSKRSETGGTRASASY